MNFWGQVILKLAFGKWGLGNKTSIIYLSIYIYIYNYTYIYIYIYNFNGALRFCPRFWYRWDVGCPGTEALWEQVQCRLVRVGSRLLGAAAKHGEALAVWHSVGIPWKRIIGVRFLAFDLGPQFLAVASVLDYIGLWPMDFNQFLSGHIHPAFVVHVEVRVLLANSADPAAVDSRGRALLLMPYDLGRCFFLHRPWDSVLSNQGQWETQTAIYIYIYLYIYIFIYIYIYIYIYLTTLGGNFALC